MTFIYLCYSSFVIYFKGMALACILCFRVFVTTSLPRSQKTSSHTMVRRHLRHKETTPGNNNTQTSYNNGNEYHQNVSYDEDVYDFYSRTKTPVCSSAFVFNDYFHEEVSRCKGRILEYSHLSSHC